MRLYFAFIACLLSLFSDMEAHAAQRDRQALPAAHLQREQMQFAQYRNTDQGDTLIDDTDLDLTEDNNYSHNAKENLKCFAGDKLPCHFNLIRPSGLVLSFQTKAIPAFPPVFAHLPRYLALRVLRI